MALSLLGSKRQGWGVEVNTCRRGAQGMLGTIRKAMQIVRLEASKEVQDTTHLCHKVPKIAHSKSLGPRCSSNSSKRTIMAVWLHK